MENNSPYLRKRHFITVLLMILCSVLIPVRSNAQQIGLDYTNEKLSVVLKEIQKETGYSFFYNNSLIDVDQLVTIRIEKGKPEIALDALFKNTGISYKIIGKQIVLSPSVQKDEVKQDKVLSDKRLVSGIVRDEDGVPLIGVSVIIEGTYKGVMTDANGFYAIEVSKDPATKLLFSYLGLKATTVEVGSQTEINITLVVNEIVIENVIVTGYQSISKERSTGSYSVLEGDALKSKALSRGSLIESLEGMAPGLNVNMNEDGDKYLIRGLTTINSERSPLFVVDGVAIAEDDIENLINNSDIKSVTLLKDATAASIWGSRAGNGVIVISTKSGKHSGNKYSVSYDGSFTFKGKPDYSYNDYMDTRTFIDNAVQIFDPVSFPYSSVLNTPLGISSSLPVVFPHEIPLYQYNSGEITLSERDALLNQMALQNQREQYEQNFMSNAFFSSHIVSISGGGEKNTLYASLGYEGQQDSYRSNVGKYKINIRQDWDIAEWIKWDLTLNSSLTESGSNTIPGVSNLPYAMLYDNNGNELSQTTYFMTGEFKDEAESLTGIDQSFYPVSDYKASTVNSTGINVRANTGLSINVCNGLKYEGRVQYLRSNTNQETYLPQETYSVRYNRLKATNTSLVQYLPATGGDFTMFDSYQTDWTIRNQLMYDNTFTGKHQVTVLAGTEIRNNTISSHSQFLHGYDMQTMKVATYDITTLDQGSIDSFLGSYAKINTNKFEQFQVDRRYFSLYSNGAYTYNNRYSLNGSFRIDQSNLFGTDPSVQWKPIWSVGGSWKINEESFMQNLNWLDRLNLRVSFGYAGNSPNSGEGGPFDLISSDASSAFSGLGMGYFISTPANDKLIWEKTRSWNIGVDYAVMGNRVQGSLDLYDKKTTDMIGTKEVDPTTGWSEVSTNLGSMSNKGIELTIESRNITGSRFNWNTNLNFSYNINEILDDYKEMVYTNAYQKAYLTYGIGHPAYALWGYRWAGLSSEDGSPQVYDTDGTTLVTNYNNFTDVDAVHYYGTTVPPLYGSLINSFTYDNWELSFMVVFNLGHKMRNDVNTFYTGRMSDRIHKDFDDRWREPGDEMTTNVPSYYIDLTNSTDRSKGSSFLYSNADINILDASYAKLRELSIAYNLPREVCNRLNLNNLKIRLQVTNLLCLAANHEGIDPEAFNLRNGTRSTLYNPSISAGLSINFK